jgi:hypothetical protein
MQKNKISWYKDNERKISLFKKENHMKDLKDLKISDELRTKIEKMQRIQDVAYTFIQSANMPLVFFLLLTGQENIVTIF